MRSPRRLLAGAAVALAFGLVASACDSSPYAASVNGHVLTQTTLNGQLSDLSANPAFVRTVEAPTTSGGAGIRVTGDTSASYSSQWTAAVLTAAATASAVHQHLVATGGLPGPAQRLAVQAVDAAAYSGGLTWYRFSPAIRSLIAQRDADMAMVVPKASNVSAATLRRLATQFSTSLFTRVCLRTMQVSVPSGSGGVDFPASLARAKALVGAIDRAGTAGANRPTFGGVVDCYGQAGFAQLPLPTVRAALSAKTGSAAAPERNPGGYEVVAVTSRTPLQQGTELARAVSVVLQVNSVYSAGSNVPAVESIVSRARVRVNPMYGAWSRTRNGWAVVPPSGPAAHAASVAGSV